METYLNYMLIAALPMATYSGFWIGKRQCKIPTDEQIYRFMDKVVNTEEMQEHQRLLRVKMMRNGRKTQRFDSGPNAKMRKMKVYRASRRFR